MGGHFERAKNGRIQVVKTSKKKSDKGSKSRKAPQEPEYVFDEERENELEAEIHNQDVAIAQLKDENNSLRKIVHDSGQVAKSWQTKALQWKDKFENAMAARDELDERVSRRDDEILKKTRDIKELSDDKKKLKSKGDDLASEASKLRDSIAVLKDNVRRLVEDKARMAKTEEKLKVERDFLANLLENVRTPQRRREELPRQRHFDSDRFDTTEHWSPRDNLRQRWGGRENESE